VWKYVDIQAAAAENRGGKEKNERKKETTAAEYNGLLYWAAIIMPKVSLLGNLIQPGKYLHTLAYDQHSSSEDQ